MVNYESHCGRLLARISNIGGGIPEVLLGFDAEDWACRGESGVKFKCRSWDLFIVRL